MSRPAGSWRFTIPDEFILRAKTREVVRTGKMLSRRPDRILGGPGVGVDNVMARPRPEKKREPRAATDTKILPMELQVGDRLADRTGNWEVIAPPYSTAGGRMVHARAQKIDQPASWEIRNWDAVKRVSVKRDR
jgi:hypothetical protein